MPYRVSYRDNRDVNRLPAVTQLQVDARLLNEAVSAEVPPAAGRLMAAEDLVFGMDLQVLQPPQTPDTAAICPTPAPADRADAEAVSGAA